MDKEAVREAPAQHPVLQTHKSSSAIRAAMPLTSMAFAGPFMVSSPVVNSFGTQHICCENVVRQPCPRGVHMKNMCAGSSRDTEPSCQGVAGAAAHKSAVQSSAAKLCTLLVGVDEAEDLESLWEN